MRVNYKITSAIYCEEKVSTLKIYIKYFITSARVLFVLHFLHSLFNVSYCID